MTYKTLLLTPGIEQLSIVSTHLDGKGCWCWPVMIRSSVFCSAVRPAAEAAECWLQHTHQNTHDISTIQNYA